MPVKTKSSRYCAMLGANRHAQCPSSTPLPSLAWPCDNGRLTSDFGVETAPILFSRALQRSLQSRFPRICTDSLVCASSCVCTLCLRAAVLSPFLLFMSVPAAPLHSALSLSILSLFSFVFICIYSCLFICFSMCPCRPFPFSIYVDFTPQFPSLYFSGTPPSSRHHAVNTLSFLLYGSPAFPSSPPSTVGHRWSGA